MEMTKVKIKLNIEINMEVNMPADTPKEIIDIYGEEYIDKAYRELKNTYKDVEIISSEINCI